MANNTTLNPGVGGDTIATEDLSGVKYPLTKIMIGAAGSIEGDVASTRPLPTVLRSSTGTELATASNPLRIDPTGATVQPISGTVGVSGTVTASANLVVGGQAVAAGNPVPVSIGLALPAGSNTIGGVVAQAATGVVYNGVTPLTPKFAAINVAAAGDNTVVAAVAGKRVRVLKYTIMSAGTVGAKFRSSSATDLTGPMPLLANSGVGGAFCPVGLFETAPGEALVLNLSVASAVGGHLTYLEV